MRTSIVFLFIMLIFPGWNFAQEDTNYLLPFNQVFKIMEESKLNYRITIEEEKDTNEVKNYTVLNNNLYLTEKDGAIWVTEYVLSDEGKKNIDLGEEAFEEENYDKAKEYYKKVIEIDPDCFKAYVFLADCFYITVNYDSAEYYFKKAIDINFINYQAHWFLADVYLKTNKVDKTMEELTIAHLLNRNHENLLKGLQQRRELTENKWDDWTIEPETNVYKKDGDIYVVFNPEWFAYACTEAVWEYEPGFTEKLFGEKYSDESLLLQKECACIITNIDAASARDESFHFEGMDMASRAIKDGYLREMAMYEVISRKYPELLLNLNRDAFNSIIDYVNKYH